MAYRGFTTEENDMIANFDAKRKKLFKIYSVLAFAFAVIFVGLFMILSTGLNYGLSTNLHNNIITRLDIVIDSEFTKEQTDPYVINAHIIQYFNLKDDLIQVNYFENNEKTHLRDVKELILFGKMLMLIFLGLAIISIVKMYVLSRLSGASSKEGLIKLLKVLQYGSLFAIVLWIVVFISYIPLSSEKFDGAFVKMHEQLFPQGNWQFPQESLLIRTYPQAFFHSLGLSIVRFSLLFITIIFVVATMLIIAAQEEKLFFKKRRK